MTKRSVLASVATACGQRNIAGFAAVRAVVKTVGAKAHVVLPFADGAVPFTRAPLFRQLTLRAIGRSLHKGPLEKLYLSNGSAARPRSGAYGESCSLLYGKRLGSAHKSSPCVSIS